MNLKRPRAIECRPVPDRLSHSAIGDLLEDITADCSDTAYTLYQLEQTSEELLMQATEIEMITTDLTEDIRQAALGNMRVCCQWCDAEFFVSTSDRGPYTCRTCRHCDGY
jgi:hypothetical protein